jgi:hypothetical protein
VLRAEHRDARHEKRHARDDREHQAEQPDDDQQDPADRPHALQNGTPRLAPAGSAWP